MTQKILYLISEDWYFASHRLSSRRSQPSSWHGVQGQAEAHFVINAGRSRTMAHGLKRNVACNWKRVPRCIRRSMKNQLPSAARRKTAGDGLAGGFIRETI